MDQEREHIGGLPCMDGEEAQDRIENLLEVMGQVIQGDYTAQARMSGTNDEFDALAMGLNMMIDELQENLDLQEQYERIRELNSELVEAKNRAQESDRLKSAFLANMSHEIRTPMNAIVGFSSLLLRGGRDPKSVHQYLTFIDNAAKHLLDLINDILDLSKIDAGELKIDIREHKLNRLLRDVMELESQDQRLKEKKNLKLVTSFPPDTDHWYVPTDEVRFRQIFLNLMSNAIKFTERGTIEFGYYLEKKEGQDQVVIYVKDSGRGIAPEMQEVIFERFRQAKTHDNVAGTGLGLSISRGLVEKMGGSIWIESEEGVGSQFFVRFPCSVKEEERIVASHVPAPPAGKGILEGKLIYIAEDNRESYILLRDILTAEGAKVAQARDGEALLMLLDVRLPDLILLDLRMPGMDGQRTMQEIKEREYNVPVVIQTANAMNDERMVRLKSMTQGYLTKPIDPEELLAELVKYIR